jgi:SMC interacting uncharacterized protein involved in chromosome segregation
MEDKIAEITDQMRKAKDFYELKMAEANKAKELFYKLQGKLELANEIEKDKLEKKSGGKK